MRCKLLLVPFFLTFAISLVTGCTGSRSFEDIDAQQKAKTARINCQLGLAYLQMNNVQRAKLKLLYALKQAPNIPEPYYSMAYFMEVTGDKSQAEFYYRKAIEIAPNRGDTHNNYGTYLCRNGKSDESIKQFLAAANDPTYLDAAGAYENAGLCALKSSRKEQAKHFFNQALNQDPQRQNALFKLAEINYKEGQYKEAKANLKQFISVAPKTYEVFVLTSPLMAKIEDRLKPAPIKPIEMVAESSEPKAHVPVSYAAIQLAEKRDALKSAEKVKQMTLSATKKPAKNLVEKNKKTDHGLAKLEEPKAMTKVTIKKVDKKLNLAMKTAVTTNSHKKSVAKTAAVKQMQRTALNTKHTNTLNPQKHASSLPIKV